MRWQVIWQVCLYEGTKEYQLLTRCVSDEVCERVREGCLLPAHPVPGDGCDEEHSREACHPVQHHVDEAAGHGHQPTARTIRSTHAREAGKNRNSGRIKFISNKEYI
ncbi:hypothetical protein TNCT_239081 [Trichonephila clavata]|uniref:Uncharacterized protein n=1 Tax=Trichonephila clavata TaxID=2740835 RepID=A0A8X6GIF2_TRICU|nr:hypothetical protein TNCT_239081 [Trichonephila clavata]